MPFTPFHFGPAFLIGILFPRHVNMAAILAASVAVDVEPVYCLLYGCQLHGLLHTYIGAAIFSLAVVATMIYLGRRQLKKVSDVLKVPQDYSFRSIAIGALAGGWSHIFLDSLMHFDVEPFWPSPENPMLAVIDSGTIYLITVAGFALGGVIYFWKAYRLQDEKRKARV